MDTEAREQNTLDPDLAAILVDEPHLAPVVKALLEAGERLREEAAEIMPRPGDWVRVRGKPYQEPGLVLGVKGARVCVEFPREHGSTWHWIDLRKVEKVRNPMEAVR